MDKLTIFLVVYFTICSLVHTTFAPQTDNGDYTIQATPTVRPRVPQMVSHIRQEYKRSSNKELYDQIQRELQASYLYQAYASYFQRADVNLPGIQKFFTKASVEERDHAQMLITYINKRGGHVLFGDLNLTSTCNMMKDDVQMKYFVGYPDKNKRMCICDFISQQRVNEDCGDWSELKRKQGLYAFRDALAVERFMNEKWLLLHTHADSERITDPHLAHFIEHEFLEEKIKSINKLANLITRLESFSNSNNYKLGEYLFDQELDA